MSKDTIYRQDAVDAINELHDKSNAWLDLAVEALEKLPSAEPERKKGKWTVTYSDCGGDVWVSWKCSNCGYVRKKGWKYTDDGKKPDALFCEMCNADMRGEWHKKK